ncbi:MAG: hypothetical protein ABFD79_08870 [Phycisphaerales bacterium]
MIDRVFILSAGCRLFCLPGLGYNKNGISVLYVQHNGRGRWVLHETGNRVCKGYWENQRKGKCSSSKWYYIREIPKGSVSERK